MHNKVDTRKLFKYAFNEIVVRKNDDSIYKGFGFKHYSDATQYYVHPNNESYRNKTSLAQPIGEAITYFVEMVLSYKDEVSLGNVYYTEDFQQVFIEIIIPQHYRDNKIVSENVYSYKASMDKDNVIFVCAYDRDNQEIPIQISELSDPTFVYRLLPTFTLLLAKEVLSNKDYGYLFNAYLVNQGVDSFVALHEDFYQNHKYEKYDMAYGRDKSFVLNGEGCQYSDEHYQLINMASMKDRYEILYENQEVLNQVVTIEETITFKEDDFDSSYMDLIPQLPEEFVLDDKLLPICNAIAQGDVLSVLLSGPAATGKTMACKLIAQHIKAPIMAVINATENLDEFVLGKYIPQEDKIVFMESYVTKAIRYGGIVIFEEINFGRPQYLSFLNSLLDDNGFVRLDNGEVIKRHPNFRFMATMNYGYYGTKELNQALFNRFNLVIEMDSLSDESIKRMLLARAPHASDHITKIISVYHKLKANFESEELDIVISPRNLENWAKLAKYEGYLKASEHTIVPIAKNDKVLMDTIRGIIMLYKWD